MIVTGNMNQQVPESENNGIRGTGGMLDRANFSETMAHIWYPMAGRQARCQARVEQQRRR